MIDLSNDVLISCLIALAVLLVFFHIHVEREFFEALPSWCLRALRNAKVQSEAMDEKKAMQFRRLVDEARIQNFKSVIRCGIPPLALVVVTHLLQTSGSNLKSGVFAWHVTAYSAALFVTYSHIHWTPMKVTAVTAVVRLMMLVRLCTIEDRAVWLLQSPARAVLRLLIGIVDMDQRKGVMWNLIFLVVNFLKTVNMTEGYADLQTPKAYLVIFEGSLFVVAWLASYSAEWLVTDCVRTAFEASASRIDKTMTDHLLSAFCDAQVKLGPHLHILGSHEKLSRILLARSPAERDLLDGTSFLDYVATADKARFKAFIEACSAPSDPCASVFTEDLDGRPKTLPSALHVHLRNSSGNYLPASIFHSAAMVAGGESHHLIGICVDSSEAFTLTTDQDSQVYHDCHSRVTSKKRTASLSSRSSSSSGRSKKSVRLIDLPLIESVEVMFDPFTWSMRKVCYNLPEADCKVTTLDGCMLQPDGHEFSCWAQEQINIVHQPSKGNDDLDQESLSILYGSIALTLPPVFCINKPILISAKSAWLVLEGLGEGDDDDEYGLVSLHLEGVQQISDKDRLKAVMSTINE